MNDVYVLVGGGFLPGVILSETNKKAKCKYSICGVESIRVVHKANIAYPDEKVLLFRNIEQKNELTIIRTPKDGFLPTEIDVDSNVGVV